MIRFSFKKKTIPLALSAGSFLLLYLGCAHFPRQVKTDPAVKAQRIPHESFDEKIEENTEKLFKEGREVFRHETFGSEDFWGGKLRLHEAILGEKQGGVGPGLTPKQALQVGLKVDVGALPKILVQSIKNSAVSLENPETTVALLKANAVIGVKGIFDKKTKKMTAVGIQCALCHSTVDDSFTKGIGRRLDGWPNRDLNVGAVAALSPNLKPMADLLGVDEATVKKVLLSWGPGKYDAELNQDGKAFRPDGKSGATVLPAAFGLAGINLHTYTGWGSVAYWNAYVANTQMYGKGTFFDPRLKDKKFPVVERSKFNDVRNNPDLVSDKLAALHFYQLAIPAPEPPKDSYNEKAAKRGEAVFMGKGQCSRCHVPPLFTEPGFAMHTGEEIGIDNFQADRSPEGMYRTTPLKGLFTRMKGGFYHDGRFQDLNAVVEHYQRVFKFDLTESEKNDLIEYLRSL